MRRLLVSVVACICAVSVSIPAWAFTLALDFFGEAQYDPKGFVSSQDVPVDYIKEAFNTYSSPYYGVGAVEYNIAWNDFPSRNENESWYVHVDIWVDGTYNNEHTENAEFYVEYQDSFFLGECSLKQALRDHKEVIDFIVNSPKEHYEPGIGGYRREGSAKAGQIYYAMDSRVDEILERLKSAVIFLKDTNAVFGGRISLSTTPQPENDVPLPASVLLQTMSCVTLD